MDAMHRMVDDAVHDSPNEILDHEDDHEEVAPHFNAHLKRVAGLNCVASNTFLPAGGTPSQAFLAWREFARSSPDFRIGPLLDRATQTPLTEAEIAAYDAPFPDEPSKAAARAFPSLVPVEDGMPGVAENKAAWPALAAFDKPFLTLFGEEDPITKGSEKFLIERIAGAAGLDHRTLSPCGHFCQEDQPEALAQGVIDMARKAGHLA